MRVEAVLGFADFAFQCFQACRQLTDFQLLGSGQAQLVRAARLHQVIGGTGLDCINRGVDRRMRSDDHHAHPRRLDTHLRQYIQTVVLAQAQVEETQVEDLSLQQGFGLRRTVGGGHTVAFIFETVAEGSQDGGLIVDQQNTALMFLGWLHFLRSFENDLG
ncbi:hypothetical protein D3C79_707180 [compost metagenome]